MLRNRSRRGFTLIELMISVAIIGILAAVAIPKFMRFQLSAKASESKGILVAIRAAQEGYYAEFSRYVSALPIVPAAIGPAKTNWPLASTDSHGFNLLGIRPEGGVWYQYGVTSSGTNAFSAAARSDIDGDGNFNSWAYVKPAPGASSGVAPPIAACAATGVYNPSTGSADRLQVVGPCDSTSGKTAF